MTQELKQSLKQQVEYYFSKQNLTHDSYLVSQMNAQMYVPLDVILNFSKVKELTNDVDLLIEAMRDSKLCSLNGEQNAIKPNIKSERNTIILREIPSDTTDEQVRAIFSDIGNVASVRSDVGDTWFVTMNTEQDAVNALLALRNQTFNNAPIKARLKSENIVRSFFPSPSPVSAAATTTTTGKKTTVVSAAGAGYYQTPMNYYPHYQSNYAASAGTSNGYRQQQPRAGATGGRYLQGQAAGHPKDHLRSGKSGARKNKEKRSKHDKKAGYKKPVLNSTNFPPLPAVADAKKDSATAIGYDGPFQAYSEDDIMEIVKHMSNEECELPAGKMDLKAHPAALNVVAHADLLKSQRTYSIDQAREAMRQGRPIRSDSVGSMDYESMMYGEDYTREARAARAAASASATSTPTSPAAAAPSAAPVPVAASSTSTTPAVKPEKPEPQQEPHPKKVGYAAALLSSPPPPPAASSSSSSSASTPARKAKEDKKRAAKKKGGNQTAAENNTASSVWGSKRSFVDVLKTESSSPSNILHSEKQQPKTKPAAASPVRN